MYGNADGCGPGTNNVTTRVPSMLPTYALAFRSSPIHSGEKRTATV